MGRSKKMKWVMPVDDQGRPIVDAYLRMSDGFDGKQDNRENQLEDIMPLYERNNWALGEVLQDEVSAWKRGVRRDDFETLLERIEQGLSAGVAFYNQDRFLRRPMDLERFLLLWEDGREGLKVASMFGEINLNDGQQRAFMRQVAAMAMAASDDTSRRTRRKNRGKRERGILIGGGPRPFAWPGKEPLRPGQKRRREVTAERLEAEREAMRWAFEHIAGGGKLAEVAREWNERELLSFYGKPWYIETVRQCMKHQRYAGRIEHDGEVVGTIADHEPLIEPELFDRVMGIFAARAHGRPLGQTSLCSGLIYCSACGTAMVSRPRYRYRIGQPRETVPSYKCAKSRGGCGGPQIDQEPANEMVRLFTIRRLSDPAVGKAVAALKEGQNARIDEVRAQLETARRTEVGLAAKLKAKRISWEAFDTLQESVFADIQQLEAELKELEEAAVDLTTVRAQSAVAVAAEWDAAQAEGDITRLRALIQEAFPARVARIMVTPSGKRKVVPPKERLQVVATGGIPNTTSRAGACADPA